MCNRVYLLHIEPPKADKRHYLGGTTINRLHRRMEEHGRGQGAALTRAALAAGCELHLVRLFVVTGWADERRLTRRGHYHKHCPICSPGIELSAEELDHKLVIRANGTAKGFGLDWTPPPMQLVPSPIEKGQSDEAPRPFPSVVHL